LSVTRDDLTEVPVPLAQVTEKKLRLAPSRDDVIDLAGRTFHGLRAERCAALFQDMAVGSFERTVDDADSRKVTKVEKTIRALDAMERENETSLRDLYQITILKRVNERLGETIALRTLQNAIAIRRKRQE